MTHVIAIFGLAFACAGWVLFQRWMAKHHPASPGEEKRLTGCGICDKSEECDEEACDEAPDRGKPAPKLLPVARVESSGPRKKR